jgi:hypothetical protein
MHLPALGVTHGHLGGPAAGDAAPPLCSDEPATAATAAATPAGPTLAAFLVAVGRAAGGPADPAVLRRAAGRPILPVDAWLRNESVDASDDANDAVSDDGGGWCAAPFVRPPEPTPPPRRRGSSCRRTSKDGTPAGSLFFAAALSSASRREAGMSLSGGLFSSLPLPAGPGDRDSLRRAVPATRGANADMASE